MMTSAPILALYDPNKDTKVNADASSDGIGGVVMQKQEDRIWKTISYVSRVLSPVECRYSQVERECLAFAWTCERSSDFVWGKSIIGETDHKLLMLTMHMLNQLTPHINTCIISSFTMIHLHVNATPQAIYINHMAM